MFQGGIALVGSLLLAAILVAIFHRWKAFGEGLSATSAFVTVLAVILTAYWFVILRPDAPKLRIAIQATPVRLAGRDLLMLFDVEIQNVGGSPVDFERDQIASSNGDALGPFQLMIQKVTPLPASVRNELNAARKEAPKNLFRVIEPKPADNWELMAWLDTHPHASIAVGEVDNLYFRTLLKCEPELRMYATIRIAQKDDGVSRILRKLRGDEHKFGWIKQVLVDASTECGDKT